MITARSLRVIIAVSLFVAALCPGAWASAWTLVTLNDAEPSRSTIEAVIDAASVDTSEPKRDAVPTFST